MPDRPLAGQSAWVTGSSRGLGRVMAEELVRLGAKVALHGTRADSPKTFGEGESMQQVADDVAASAGGETMAVWGDMTREADVQRVIATALERFGPLDILHNNVGASISVGDAPADSLTEEAFDRSFAVNLKTAWLAT